MELIQQIVTFILFPSVLVSCLLYLFLSRCKCFSAAISLPVYFRLQSTCYFANAAPRNYFRLPPLNISHHPFMLCCMYTLLPLQFFLSFSSRYLFLAILVFSFAPCLMVFPHRTNFHINFRIRSSGLFPLFSSPLFLCRTPVSLLTSPLFVRFFVSPHLSHKKTARKIRAVLSSRNWLIFLPDRLRRFSACLSELPSKLCLRRRILRSTLSGGLSSLAESGPTGRMRRCRSGQQR